MLPGMLRMMFSPCLVTLTPVPWSFWRSFCLLLVHVVAHAGACEAPYPGTDECPLAVILADSGAYWQHPLLPR